MAARKKATGEPRKKTTPRAKVLKVEDFNTSAWEFYRPRGVVKVAHLDDGKVYVAYPDGKVKEMSEEDLLKDFEPFKGLGKENTIL